MKFTCRTLLMSLAGSALSLSVAATAQETPAQSAPTQAPPAPGAVGTTDVPASTLAPAPAEQPAPETDKDKAEKPKT